MAQRSHTTSPDMISTILSSISDGVFTVDEGWRITSFNQAAEQITGVAANEAIGHRCCEVFRASVCESDCSMRRTLETGERAVGRALYIVTADGERVPISISTAILRDAQGKRIGGVETFRDLSMVAELRKKLEDRHTFSDIIGRSHLMRQIFDILPQVAESDSTVLIEGASGTGKELVAHALHNLSARRAKRFVAINCGALPDTLLASELFGHRAGAFTDARGDKPGRFVFADGGTIFLDEICDVSPAMQVSLLRVLQEKTVEPLGASDPVSVDVRVIAAGNKDLADLVKEGAFRADLYYRINVVRLELPTLRDRREDIPLLIDHFVSKFSKLQNKDVAGVSDDVASILMDYDYPGNVRELENIIEHAFVLCRGGIIEVWHLPAVLREACRPGMHRQGTSATLRNVERMHIIDAVHRHNGSRVAAARELGINPSTLFRKIKSMGIDLPKRDGRHRG